MSLGIRSIPGAGIVACLLTVIAWGPQAAAQDSTLNIPPTVRIAEPPSGAVYQAPADVAIFAQPGDVDGIVETVEFFNGTNSLGIVTNNPMAMSPINPWHLFWKNVPVGLYGLSAKATDDKGAVGWSDIVRISVVASTNRTIVNVVASDPDAEEIPVVPPDMGMPQRVNPAVFTISRTGNTTDPLIVYFRLSGTASNGVDYEKVEDSITIPAGGSSADVGIYPIDDFLVEGTETVVLTLEAPVCAAIFPPPPGCYEMGASRTAVAFIRDNDSVSNAPTIVNVVASDPDAEEIPVVPPWLDIAQRINPAAFTISRTGSTNDPLTVYFRLSGTASNGVDYEKVGESVIIPAGASAADVGIDPIDDFLVEGTETVVLTLEPIFCPAIFPPPPGCYTLGALRSAVAYIRDNDTVSNALPDVVITQPKNGEVFVAPDKITIEAAVTDPDGYVSHVDFFANGRKIGEETINFFVEPPPGQTMTFSFDWVKPAPGPYELVTRATDNLGAVGVSPAVRISVTGTNVPPPTLPIVTITAVDPFASEGADSTVLNTATFAVRRSGPTNSGLTVAYSIGGSASNGVDYVELPGFVTIPAGERAARIVVTPTDDKLAEGPETVVLSLVIPPSPLAVINPPPPYIIGFPGRAAAVIVDNDSLRPPTRCLSDGLFHACFPGTNGFCYRLEISTNLIHWLSVCTNSVTDGAIHFIDPDTHDFQNRFYRAVPEPCVPEP